MIRRSPGILPRLSTWLALAVILCAAEAWSANGSMLLPPDWNSPADDASGLVSQLERVTGLRLAVESSSSAFDYLDRIEHGDFDLTVAPAHVAGWLIEAGLARALVSRTRPRSYILVTSRQNQDLYQASDLAGKKLCSGVQPDYFEAHFNQLVGNPQQEPIMISIKDPATRIRRMLSGHCLAALIGENHYGSMTEQVRLGRLRVLYQSKTLPSHTLLIHHRHPREIDAPLSLWLLGPRARALLAELVHHTPPQLPQWQNPDPTFLKQQSPLIEGLLLPELE